MLNMMRFERDWEVVSAGFIVHSPEGVACYGMSVTFDVKSRGKEDSAVISKLLGVGS